MVATGTCDPSAPTAADCTDAFGNLTTTFGVGCVETDTIVTITAADADAPQFSGDAEITVNAVAGGVCP